MNDHDTCDCPDCRHAAVKRAIVAFPYTPDTWTPEQVESHRSQHLDEAIHKASCLCGGWYERPVTVDYRIDDMNESGEAYRLRPSEASCEDGWTPLYTIAKASQ